MLSQNHGSILDPGLHPHQRIRRMFGNGFVRMLYQDWHWITLPFFLRATVETPVAAKDFRPFDNLAQSISLATCCAVLLLELGLSRASLSIRRLNLTGASKQGDPQAGLGEKLQQCHRTSTKCAGCPAVCCQSHPTSCRSSEHLQVSTLVKSYVTTQQSCPQVCAIRCKNFDACEATSKLLL